MHNLLVGPLLLFGLASSALAEPGLRFEVRLAPNLAKGKPESGRVLVAIAQKGSEPDFTRYRPPVLPVLGVDADSIRGNEPVVLDSRADIFPIMALNDLPAGEYTVQAIFATNRDINLPDAPGNAYCEPVTVKLDPANGSPVRLTLDRRFDERLPRNSATHRYLALPSKRLSEFHGRPMVYRVGVVLPPNFDANRTERYGLIVDIGGFGTRYTSAARLRPDPRFVQVVPDGAGPYGDPYQVNSANNGPYGDALLKEVIPYLEANFACGGDGRRRFTCGGSTGGWVSLALQIFYPDDFNGCWSQCPDSVTFERFELIDIYNDANAYLNRWGFERPSTRTHDGDVISSVRHESRLDRILGRGGRWELGGRDWASWNAVYGPRGQDGKPVPIWDGETGAINKEVLPHWERYDLTRVLVRNWKTLGPKLSGKVNIWVGDADDYYLNCAVERMKAAVTQLRDPVFDGRILIEPGAGHTSGGWSRRDMLDAMARRGGLR